MNHNKNEMAKIRIIQPTPDKNDPRKMYKVGDILDLGGVRNKSAVQRNLAVWVDSSVFEKEMQRLEAKGELVDGKPVNLSEKVEAPKGKVKKVTKAGSAVIETKKKEK